MSRDSRLDYLGAELDRIKAEYARAKERVGACAAELDRVRADVDYYKREIVQLKSAIDSERQMASACYAAGDHYSAKSHSYNIQNMRPRLDSLYDGKQRAYGPVETARARFQQAVDEKRRLGTQLRTAREAFNNRLAEVRAEKAREQSRWHEKRCKSCGAIIRYHEDWARVPDTCKPCHEAEKAKWKEKACRGCGRTIRYNTDWSHPPNFCKVCKGRFAGGRG